MYVIGYWTCPKCYTIKNVMINRENMFPLQQTCMFCFATYELDGHLEVVVDKITEK